MMRKVRTQFAPARTLRATVAPAVAIVLLFVTLPATADARQCKNVILRQGAGGGVYNGTKTLTATRTSCAIARRVARTYISSGDSSQPDYSPLGFRCRARPGGKGMRCTKGASTISWRWYYS